MEFDAQPYTVCEVAAGQDLRVFHTGADGAVLGSFGRVDEALAAEGKTLQFAMNAGMYHSDRAPVGLLVTEGVERARIITREGPGNFGLLPNGVFCIGDDTQPFVGVSYNFSNSHSKERVCARFTWFMYASHRESL